MNVSYTNKLMNRMKIIPDTEMIVSSSDHVRNVSLIVRPKYSLNIQKPASFTCDRITLPAPIASTTSATLTSECCSNGNTIPVVEMAATVAEPKAIRNTAATIHASKIGDIVEPSNIFAIVSPTPPSISTCLNVPPPPMMRIIMPIG